MREKINENAEKSGKCRLDGKKEDLRAIMSALELSDRSPDSLYDFICKKMERSGFTSDSDFYNSIGMSRQTFSRLRYKNNSFSKQNILLMAVGLGLDYKDAAELLRLAGYAFRPEDRRDVILTYIFMNMSYDLPLVNEILEHFGQKPLANFRGDKY